jgi:hypothetical protein
VISKVFIETYQNGYLMITICARDMNRAWKEFEYLKKKGLVPFYPYPHGPQ